MGHPGTHHDILWDIARGEILLMGSHGIHVFLREALLGYSMTLVFCPLARISPSLPFESNAPWGIVRETPGDSPRIVIVHPTRCHLGISVEYPARNPVGLQKSYGKPHWKSQGSK